MLIECVEIDVLLSILCTRLSCNPRKAVHLHFTSFNVTMMHCFDQLFTNLFVSFGSEPLVCFINVNCYIV